LKKKTSIFQRVLLEPLRDYKHPLSSIQQPLEDSRYMAHDPGIWLQVYGLLLYLAKSRFKHGKTPWDAPPTPHPQPVIVT